MEPKKKRKGRPRTGKAGKGKGKAAKGKAAKGKAAEGKTSSGKEKVRKGKGRGKGSKGKGKGGGKAGKEVDAVQDPPAQSQEVPARKRAKKSSTDLDSENLAMATTPASESTAKQPTRRTRKPKDPKVSQKEGGEVQEAESKKKGKSAEDKPGRRSSKAPEGYVKPKYTYAFINPYWHTGAVGVKVKVGGKHGKEAGIVIHILFALAILLPVPGCIYFIFETHPDCQAEVG